MDQRYKFVLRALEPGANISELCREHGISRKTGYKWLERFRTRGVDGLADLSRRPHSNPLRASGDVVLRIIELRRAHPRWGARKLNAVLARELAAADVPSVSTIGRVLERAGLTRRRRRKLYATGPSTSPSPLVEGPNDLWTVDFKGWWLTRDRRRAEPLTVRDAYSRFVLCAELTEGTTTEAVKPTFQRLFETHGLPTRILVDNGSPFICVRARGGLTRLSAWWVALGIDLCRGRPGHPEDNGGHERMHLDLKHEVQEMPADDLIGQRHALELWRNEFNTERPHEALEMKVPGDLYRGSPRRYREPGRPLYPPTFERRRVNNKGRTRYRGEMLYIGKAVAGYDVGVRMLDDAHVGIRFYGLDLGSIEYCPMS